MNLPASFTDSTRALLGDEEYRKLAVALQQESPVSIRLNGDKMKSAFDYQKCVPWSGNGFYLDQRLTFTFDPLFHAGCYYVQEASSMFVEQVLKRYVTEPVLMLDLCAAPGGKSTHARSLLPVGSLLVANEVIRNRSQILAENLTKWGHPDVVVTNNDPSDFGRLGSFFDVILTDVPCSGEGMFRKDAGAIDEWSVENVEICWQRQRRIIADIWPCLKPGGLLIYSTCTYNTKEDEENIDWMMREFGAEALPLDIPQEWNVIANLLAGTDFPVYRFLPHHIIGEGFFLAVVRKPLDAESDEPEQLRRSSKKSATEKGKNKPQAITKEMIKIAGSWLNDAEDYTLSAEDVRIAAYPTRFLDELAVLKQTLRVVLAGVALGEVKGKDLIPDHALAMSKLLKSGTFPSEELTYEQAISYLRKEAISLSAEAPRGFVLVTYRDTPLGFVKNIGNRANNLYPQEWRIRSGYLPEEVRVL